jgi:putative ABC transport system ATP-binding protein
MAEPLVLLRGVGRRYATGAGELWALAGVTLDVAAGEVLAVTGPSGSGKSTLLHLVGAMETPTIGTIRVGGWQVEALPPRRLAAYRRTVGFVFQRFHLLPALTALDNVASPLLPYRTPFDKIERARGLLADVGLAGKAAELPAKLSGGQQQRVAIARALVNEPALLLADEPTGNLDSGTGTEIMGLLGDLRERRGTTIVVATHDLAVAARCDRVVGLRDGRLVEGAAPETPDGVASP